VFFTLLHLCFRLYDCNYGRVEDTVLYLIDSSVHKPPFLIQTELSTT